VGLLELNLKANEIGDHGAISLAEMLQSNSTVTKINLAENQITNNGANKLLEALKYNSSLTTLNLEDNNCEASMISIINRKLGENNKKGQSVMAILCIVGVVVLAIVIGVLIQM